MSLIDYDYFAKYLALISLINDAHPITGDNLKYIYDFTNGKFRILFRQESGNAFPIRGSLENFNNSLFKDNNYEFSQSHQLFKILISNKEFRNKKDFYLKKILDDKDNILINAEKIIHWHLKI